MASASRTASQQRRRSCPPRPPQGRAPEESSCDVNWAPSQPARGQRVGSSASRRVRQERWPMSRHGRHHVRPCVGRRQRACVDTSHERRSLRDRRGYSAYSEGGPTRERSVHGAARGTRRPNRQHRRQFLRLPCRTVTITRRPVPCHRPLQPRHAGRPQGGAVVIVTDRPKRAERCLATTARVAGADFDPQKAATTRK